MFRRDVSDTFERGDPYEMYVGRWSRQVAPRFLAWLRLPAAASGAISLIARAWAVRGVSPGQADRA